MKATTKSAAKSEAQVLGRATDNLLRALKRDMIKKAGRVDFAKLRKDGHSDHLLAKLELISPQKKQLDWPQRGTKSAKGLSESRLDWRRIHSPTR